MSKDHPTDHDNSSSSSSACPVSKDATVEQNGSSSWGSWLGWNKKSSQQQDNNAAADNGLPSSCPVSDQHQSKTPASLEEAAAYAQTPHPDQKGVSLSTQRVISSIPRGATASDEKGPHHQPQVNNSTTTTTTDSSTSDKDKTTKGDGDNACKMATNPKHPSHWMYPSEQQFFHALRKKGWDNVEAESIPSVLQIHNTINERTWNQIQEWESTMDIEDNRDVNTNLKLVRFMGRPNDMSPQAFVWTKIFQWADPPFDRHDWYVQKQQQPQRQHKDNSSTASSYPIQRYVIDYYMFPPLDPQMPPTPFVDARPALDSPRALYLRAVRLLHEELPGITAEWQSWKAQRKRYYDGSLPGK
jgi:cytochrome c heme-lyase